MVLVSPSGDRRVGRGLDRRPADHWGRIRGAEAQPPSRRYRTFRAVRLCDLFDHRGTAQARVPASGAAGGRREALTVSPPGCARDRVAVLSDAGGEPMLPRKSIPNSSLVLAMLSVAVAAAQEGAQ